MFALTMPKSEYFWREFLLLKLELIIFSWEVLIAAAAKSLQSCLTPCDPLDGSPPGSSVHGIFQARVLAWGATAFSDLHVYLYIKYVPGSDESNPEQKCHRLLQLLPRVQQLFSIKAYQITMYLWAISRFLKWLLCQYAGSFLFFVLFRERICQVP